MAETGVTAILAEEVGKAVEEGNADQFIGQQHWFCPAETSHSSCGDTSFTIRLNSEFPQLTLVSMLGPSPDWFVGMSGLSLRDEHGWRPAFTFELYPYDGGSRRANQFALFGEKSNPQETIELITEASGQLVGPQSLGRLHFRPLTFLKLIMDDERLRINRDGPDQIILTWEQGLLQSASGLSEIWTTVEGATSPRRARVDSRASFFRLEYR